MEALRNVSKQSFLIHLRGGGNLHLLPGRAVALSAEELKSSQVQHLLNGGLARLERLGKETEAEAPAAKKKLKRHK